MRGGETVQTPRGGRGVACERPEMGKPDGADGRVEEGQGPNRHRPRPGNYTESMVRRPADPMSL